MMKKYGGNDMKVKALCFILCMCTILSILTGCQGEMIRYKRISLQGEMLGDESVIKSDVKVNNLCSETYSDTMPVYQIAPRNISIDEFKQFASYFGANQPVEYTYGTNYPKITNQIPETDDQKEWYKFVLRDHSISYRVYRDEIEMKQTDEELEAFAKEIFAALPLIDGEYEYLGETSTQTCSTSSGSFVVKKRISFRRLIDDTRVIGDDICDFYFDAVGLCGIEIKLFSYDRISEIEMITLDEAVKQVENPDGFTVYSADDKDFTGKVDMLSIERTKLLFVNQYENGCEILQPVYNLMGTATNENGSSEFSAKIIFKFDPSGFWYFSRTP